MYRKMLLESLNIPLSGVNLNINNPILNFGRDGVLGQQFETKVDKAIQVTKGTLLLVPISFLKPWLYAMLGYRSKIKRVCKWLKIRLLHSEP